MILTARIDYRLKARTYIRKYVNLSPREDFILEVLPGDKTSPYIDDDKISLSIGGRRRPKYRVITVGENWIKDNILYPDCDRISTKLKTMLYNEADDIINNFINDPRKIKPRKNCQKEKFNG